MWVTLASLGLDLGQRWCSAYRLGAGTTGPKFGQSGGDLRCWILMEVEAHDSVGR